MRLKIISAGAGSGKTYRLTEEMVQLLASGEVRAGGIIATTFTKKAAAELQERVRVKLLEKGMAQEAHDLANALIGTVHGLGVKLLKRFAFEAGVSPQVDIIADEDQQVMFNQSLAMVLTHERVEEMERLSDRLGLNKSEYNITDWRNVLKDLTEVARANDFSPAALEKSKIRSFESFRAFLDEPVERPAQAWNDTLAQQLEDAITRLENNGDATKTTADAVKVLRETRQELANRGMLFWHQWVKISKTKVGAKSRNDMEPLVVFVHSHLAHKDFHEDIQSFIFNVFEIAQHAIEEYDAYKKRRGLIDYTDMEVLVKRLLDDLAVQEVLAAELDLLMVDEFQDTNPLQLEIFLKLSRFAKYSVWVGDPKQSIYGFRGAEPALMEAIIRSQGGLKKENILQHSWRSREDIVHATNAIFTKAFGKMPAEQVALLPKRFKKTVADSANKTDEPQEMGNALVHWHFKYDGEGRKPGKSWLNQCLAETLRTRLERGWLILPKGESSYRPALPGDVAILCRSNKECLEMAGALHRAGLRAAISRAGLLGTAEARLILACLKFILNKYDSLSIAEILLLAARLEIEEIIEDRLDYLEKLENEGQDYKWGEQNGFIRRLNALRPEVVELSGSEILTLLLEELDLRRIIASWGNLEQRLANVDVLCNLAGQYEETCNRLHSAASLGGFLLWLNDLESSERDMQGSGENAGAVNVLTYHKSKGLEYPIAVCHSLENSLREEVWGLTLVSESDEIDLSNLLGNRWIRFWVNPYSDQFRSTLLEERINGSPVKSQKRLEALEEEARLLYVGITRARDYLVFPSREKPTIWLNRVFHNGDENIPVLDPNSSESCLEWNGQWLEMQTEQAWFPDSIPHADLPEEDVLYLNERAGKAAHSPYQIDPNHEFQHRRIQVRTVAEHSFSHPLQISEVPERQFVARALKSMLLSDRPHFNEKNRAVLAEGLLHRYEVVELTDPDDFLVMSNGFTKWMEANFTNGPLARHFPLAAHFGGRFFQCTVDVFAETGTLVFLSAFVGDAKARQKKLREMGPFLWYGKQAAQWVTGNVHVKTMVGFVLYGSIAEVVVETDMAQNVGTNDWGRS